MEKMILSYKCLDCGHVFYIWFYPSFLNRRQPEKQCSKCESYNIRLLTKTCLRCDHQWIPKTDSSPRICPRCKSPHWEDKDYKLVWTRDKHGKFCSPDKQS